VHAAYAAAAAYTHSPAVTWTCPEQIANAIALLFADVGKFRAAPLAAAAQQHTVIEGSPGKIWQIPLTASVHESD